MSNPSYAIKASNRFMELIFDLSHSPHNIGESEQAEIEILWSLLTDYGKDTMQIWAEQNDLSLPSFCR